MAQIATVHISCVPFNSDSDSALRSRVTLDMRLELAAIDVPDGETLEDRVNTEIERVLRHQIKADIEDEYGANTFDKVRQPIYISSEWAGNGTGVHEGGMPKPVLAKLKNTTVKVWRIRYNGSSWAQVVLSCSAVALEIRKRSDGDPQ